MGDYDFQRYLGRILSISPSIRINIEFQYHQQTIWTSFHRHESVLLNHAVSQHVRMEYVEVCVGPALLFCTAVLRVSRSQLQKIDILQRKMSRRIVGWRRIDDNDWNIDHESNEYSSCLRI